MQSDKYRPPVRLAIWGHEGIAFWVRSQGRARRVGGLRFASGPCGPYAGQVGSPLRAQYLEHVRDWVHTGELPDEVAFA